MSSSKLRAFKGAYFPHVYFSSHYQFLAGDCFGVWEKNSSNQ